MGNRRAIAVLLAMAAVAISQDVPAAPLSPSPPAIRSADMALVMRVQSKNGAVIRSTGQLRTFRPSHVARIRPTFGRDKVRPGRPLAHRGTVHPHHLDRARRGQLAKRQRPRRIHVAEIVLPELPPAIYDDNTREQFPLSPDFCRYWEDRGVFIGDFEPCW